MKTPTLPTFIGIGAPKAGTTWLFQCLQEHPDIFIATCKETNFFDYATIEGRIAEYEAHFTDSAGAVAVGEISTRYLGSTRAPERIRCLLPDVRLFVSLRNPIDQVYSHYWHLLRQNFHQWDRRTHAPRSFEEALELYPQRLLQPATYHHHLRHWLSYFDRSALLIMFYDDICTRPREVLDELYAFLGVDSTFVPPSIGQTGASVRRGVSPRSPLLGRMHDFVYVRLNHTIYRPLKRIVGTRSADQIKNGLRFRQVMEALFLRQGYPPMRPATRAMLRERLAGDIDNLATLTGRQLNHWR